MMPPDTWATTVAVPAKLRHEVRKLFENSAREWRDGGYRSGTLDRAALHKVAVNRPEIFSRRHSADGIDSAVVILLDVSGSMGPSTWTTGEINKSKMSAAVAACVMLLDCLAQAGAQTMVIGFGTDTHTIKGWNQNWRTVAQIIKRIRLEGDTNDWHALRLAHQHLLLQPAARRVVFALTDGIGNQYATHTQREAGERLGIQHYALGIQHDARDTWGKNTVRVDTVADLGRVAFQQVRRAA